MEPTDIDDGKAVRGTAVVWGRDLPELLEFVGAAFDQVALLAFLHYRCGRTQSKHAYTVEHTSKVVLAAVARRVRGANFPLSPINDCSRPE